MEVEKMFRPSRWFVYFCGALVLVWLALQFVANARLTEDAKHEAKQLFEWSWPQLGVSSQADITEAKVVSRSDADAVVEVKGRQDVKVQAAENEAAGKSEVIDCAAKLTFYKSNNNWILGKVELQ